MQGNMKSIAKMGWVISMILVLNICKIMTKRVLGSWLLEVPQCTETWDASLLAPLHHLGVADVI